MDDIQEKIAKARAAGYTPDQIAEHLGGLPGFGDKVKAAKSAGYKSDEIISHLTGGTSTPAPTSESADAAQARTYIENGRKARGDAAFKAGSAVIPDLVNGAAMGVSDIGNTALNAASYLPGKLSPAVAQWSRTRNADFDAITEQNKDSTAFKGGRLAGNIAATLPVGGTLAAGVRAVAPAAIRLGASAPLIEGLANASATGGFRTGMPAAATLGGKAADLGIRAAGGALSGGASGALIDPSTAGTSAIVGGVLPVGIKAAGATAGYIGNVVNSVVQPFTAKGQEAIAGRIVKKFAEGGPTTINARELVPGSAPTLAEATGNAGIATFQRGARDMNPNAFVAREAQNAGARNALFDNIAGDAGKLDFYRASRSDAAKDLYENALSVDPSANLTPYIKGQITQLLKRPSIDDASRTAQKWAIERGEQPYMAGSMAGLHDVKTALDDKLAAAVRDNQGGEVKALKATQSKLLDVMERLSPDYKEARVTYAGMSQPINAMESLQGLRLTDAQGNMTLAKVKNAMESLERARNAPGTHPAKSIADDQMQALQAIHADLLRQANLGLGRSVNSATFQNISTNNLLSALLPGKAGEIVGGKVGGFVGQVGKLAYSGPNEAIRNKLLEMALEPASAAGAFVPAAPRIPGRVNALMEAAGPTLYRAAPALSSSH